MSGPKVRLPCKKSICTGATVENQRQTSTAKFYAGLCAVSVFSGNKIEQFRRGIVGGSLKAAFDFSLFRSMTMIAPRIGRHSIRYVSKLSYLSKR
eukprot:scaffold9178_cov176-Amphora_coffeaeformis.AAC.7